MAIAQLMRLSATTSDKSAHGPGGVHYDPQRERYHGKVSRAKMPLREREGLLRQLRHGTTRMMQAGLAHDSGHISNVKPLSRQGSVI